MAGSRVAARILVLVVFVLLARPGTVYAEESAEESAQSASDVSGRLLIGVQPGLSQQEVAAQLDAAGLQLNRYWPRMASAEALPLATARTAGPPAAAVSVAALDALAQNQFARETFRFASADQVVHAADDSTTVVPPQREAQPNDPLYSQQWAPALIDAVQSWNVSYGSSSVAIGIIDSGYDPNHPDIDVVTFVVFSDSDKAVYQKALERLV